MIDILDIIGLGALSSFFTRGEEKQKENITPPSTPMKYSYRPKTLDEYIGQDKAKQLVRLNLQKIMTTKPVHFIFSGFAGCGKTTLATVIANQLGFPVSYYIGGTFSLQNIKDFIMTNERGATPRVLLIDEIHNLDKALAEFMYPLVEDFIFPEANVQCRPFIFMGASTEKSSLIKKFKPLIDRCACQIVLEPYTVKDIKEILTQYNNKTYHAIISDIDLTRIANNVRYTPRIALALFDDFMVTRNVDSVLSAHRILDNSLTDTDIKILKHLAEILRPIGEEVLALVGQTERADYKSFYEPFLIQEGYISRTSRGRIITKKGIDIVNRLG